MNKVKPKKMPPKVENMSKEEIAVFFNKKRECDAFAQKVVISLIDNGFSEVTFRENLRYINQSHYEDITEERAIIKNCGYPMCTKKLPESMPAQQYKISVRTNRVFDITARKNFCSNGCYKASLFVKEQLLTSPLWCREKEDIPDFKLIVDKKGILGDEIDLHIVKKIDVEENKDNSFRSLLDFTEASLTEISLDSQGKNISVHSVEVINDSSVNSNLESIPEQYSNSESNDNIAGDINNCEDSAKLSTVDKPSESTETGEVKSDLKKSNSVKKSVKKVNSSNIVGEIIERRSENRIDPFISEGNKMVLKEQSSSNGRRKTVKVDKEAAGKRMKQPLSVAVIHIEKCLGEWFSLETILLLFGEEKVKQMVSDKGDCIKTYLNNMANGLFYKSTSYDQYQVLCRKLNLLELEDRRYDNKVVSKELKPLPHYSMLQEESKTLDIKVRAFFKGDMEIPSQKSNCENVAKKQENVETEEERNLTNLPLVDKTSQNALRRKIVLTALNKVLPDLLQILGISSREVSSDVRLLVATFNLQANNILFKPAQWSFIAMVFVKLLSLRDLQLKKCLEFEKANKHLQLLLLSYEQDGGYLDRLISWLTDVDRLLDSNDTQLTVGTVMPKQ